MMKKKKISVCVVVYNQSDVIARCIDSIIFQDFNNTEYEIELIISDDCSQDGTRDILNSYKYRYPQLINLILNDKNLGPFKNYKLVHSLANGEYICHCDGDDYWLPGKIKEQISFLEKNKNYVAVYNNAVLIDPTGVEVGFFNRRVRDEIDGRYLVDKGNFLHHSSMMYRGSISYIVKNLPDDFIDYRIHISFSRCGALGYLNMVLTAYQLDYAGSILKNKKQKISKLYFESFLSIDVQELGFLFSSKIIAREIFRFIKSNKFSFESINYSVGTVIKNFGYYLMFFSLFIIPFLWIFKIQNKVEKLLFRKKEKHRILCVR